MYYIYYATYSDTFFWSKKAKGSPFFLSHVRGMHLVVHNDLKSKKVQFEEVTKYFDFREIRKYKS